MAARNQRSAPRSNVSRPQWGDLSKIFQNRPSEIPVEFEIADTKIKELHQLLVELQKLVKKFLKSLMAYGGASGTLANQFQELASYLQDNGELGILLPPVLRKLSDATVACSVSHNDMREKIEHGIQLYERYIEEHILPAREAKRAWQKAKLEHEQAKRKVEEFLKQSQVQEHFFASKLLLAQIQDTQLRKKEMEKFEQAADALGDTIWLRDFHVLKLQAEMMMELHDNFLNTYSHYYALEEFFQQMKSTVMAKKERYERKLLERKQMRSRKEEEEFHARYNNLVDLLVAENLAVVNAVSLTAGAEQEEILSSVISILDAYKKTMPIIKLAITTEVESTNSATTLFRGNSMSTKLMSQFTRMTGKKYLQILSPLILEVAKNPANFEVDPSKAGPGADINTNLVRLRDTVQRFLDVIVRSQDECPIPFKHISNKLQQEVLQRFPTAGLTGVTGFIFLRFFCPYILTPEQVGLTSGLSEAQVQEKNFRRALILISKVIQNVANGVKFGSKESFLEPLNDVVDAYAPAVAQFMTIISNPPPIEEYEPLCSMEIAQKLELPKLHLKIIQNLEKIAKQLQNNKEDEVLDALLLVLGDLAEYMPEAEVKSEKPTKPKNKLFG